MVSDLRPCPTCGKDFAYTAKSCPHCGHRPWLHRLDEELGQAVNFVFATVALIALLAILAAIVLF